MGRRIGAAVGIAVAGALALAGCGAAASSGSSSPTGKPVSGGDLVIARSADIIAMDKTTTFDNNSLRVM